MASLPLLLMSSSAKLYHWVRKIAYADMERQARGWVPDDKLIEPRSNETTPLQLDFDIHKKHRLKWAHHRVNHLLH